MIKIWDQNFPDSQVIVQSVDDSGISWKTVNMTYDHQRRNPSYAVESIDGISLQPHEIVSEKSKKVIV